MLQIYRNSTKVLVWLGKDEENHAKIAIASIDEIALACCNKYGITPSQLRLEDDLQPLVRGVRYHLLACNTDETWLSLTWYFKRSWFSRLWVFQEVNSEQKVDMICGGYVANWDVVALAATYLRSWPNFRVKSLQSNSENAYIMRDRKLHAHLSLPQLLGWGRSFQASDPRDRIYGFLGMPSLRNLTTAFEADYDKSRLQLYQEVAERCLLALRDYDILSHVQHINRVQDDFPSWIPQWDQPRKTCEINSSFDWTWKASRQVSGSARSDLHRSVLFISGLLLDIVETVTTLNPFELSDPEIYLPENHPLAVFWHSQISKPEIYLTGEKMLDVYALVHTTGVDIRGQKAHENREEFDADFAAFIAHTLGRTNEDIDQFQTLLQEARHGDWRSSYQLITSHRCWNRSLFTTKEGYMGLGSNALQIGDLVCILFGCSVPFILRPQNGHYQLVGEAYVHGVMEGEMIDKWEDGKLQSQEFEIH